MRIEHDNLDSNGPLQPLGAHIGRCGADRAIHRRQRHHQHFTGYEGGRTPQGLASFTTTSVNLGQ